MCFTDSDAFFVKPVDLSIELSDIDLAGPLIYKDANTFYPHTGLYFINLRTVLNFREMNWTSIFLDTGSGLWNFIKNNRHYRIKKLGYYDGYDGYVLNIENGHTIKKMKEHFIDTWMDECVIHIRAGSCFGSGSNCLKNDNTRKEWRQKYIQKLNDVFKYYNISFSFK